MKKGTRITPFDSTPVMNANHAKMNANHSSFEMEFSPEIRSRLEPPQYERTSLEPAEAVQKSWRGLKNERRKYKAHNKSPLEHRASGRLIIGLGLDPDTSIQTYGCYDVDPSGNSDVIHKQIVSTMNRNLIQYFARLSCAGRHEQFIDLMFVQDLVDSEADIDTTDRHGQTPLHEVARAWCVDVARFLIEILHADVNKGDHYGRTPLHVAAAVDYPEMCDYLVQAGANLEAVTRGENQTPVYYAARNDSDSALKTLLKHGAKFKRVMDYKCRSPMAVAAELNRSKTVKLLLDMGAPADVCDDSGQPAIVPIVSRMDSIANSALDQFLIEDRANRMQYYHLWKLEPGNIDGDGSQRFMGVLQTIVNHRQFDIVMHPVIHHLIEVHWNDFAKIRVIGSMLFQLLYILSWTVFSVNKEWYKRYEYKLPTDGWRIANFAFAVILTIWQIVEEIVEYRSSVTRHREWKEWKLAEISRDEAHCHPQWPEEKKYLQQEKSVLDSTAPSYFSDGWNIFDWLCYSLLVASTVLHVVDIFYHSLLLARWYVRIQSLTLIILWLRFMKAVRAFSLLGPFIVILGHIFTDIFRFFFLYMEFFIPFAISFYLIIGGHENLPSTIVETHKTVPVNATYVKVSGFVEYYDILFTMFRLTMVESYDYDNMVKIDKIFVQLLLGFWISISAILCLNLFIALLSDTFGRVYDNARSHASMQKADTVLSIYNGLYAYRRRRFNRYLQTSCNPESVYFESSSYYIKEEDLKKVTVETKEMVQGIQEQMDIYFNKDLGDKNIVDDDGDQLSGRRMTLIFSGVESDKKQVASSSGESKFVKLKLQQMEDRLDNLSDDINKQRTEIIENFRKEMDELKSLLKDLPIVISGVDFERELDESQPEKPLTKKKKKRKRPQPPSDDPATSHAIQITPVDPAEPIHPPPPMQIETYPSRVPRTPSIKFLKPPAYDEADA